MSGIGITSEGTDSRASRVALPMRLAMPTTNGLFAVFAPEKYVYASGLLVNAVGDGSNDLKPSALIGEVGTKPPDIFTSTNLNGKPSLRFTRNNGGTTFNILEILKLGLDSPSWTINYVVANSVDTAVNISRILFGAASGEGIVFNAYTSRTTGKISFGTTGSVSYDTTVDAVNGTKMVCTILYSYATKVFRFYLNGTLVYTSPATLNMKDLKGAFVIGNAISRSTAPFDGTLGYLDIYSRELTTGEVTNHYNFMNGAF